MTFKTLKTVTLARVVSLSALLLTACASTPPQDPLTLPPSLFRCLPEPTPPNLNADTKDSQVALFIKDLAYAGRDCRAQLAEVGHMIDLQPEITLADVVVTKEKPEKSGWKFWK